MDKFYEIMAKRTTVRHFERGYKIPQETINKWNLLAADQPTSINGQALSFIAVQNQETKDKLKDLVFGQKHVGDASVVYIFVADQRKYIKSAEMNGVDPYEYLSELESLLTPFADSFIAAQTLAIAAQLDGYGSCYIGSVRAAITKIRELLDLPEYAMPIVGLVVGKITKESGIKPKVKSATIFAEKYDLNRVESEVVSYDKIMVKYFTERGARDRSTWTDRIVRTNEMALGFYKQTKNDGIKKAWPNLKI